MYVRKYVHWLQGRGWGARKTSGLTMLFAFGVSWCFLFVVTSCHFLAKTARLRFDIWGARRSLGKRGFSVTSSPGCCESRCHDHARSMIPPATEHDVLRDIMKLVVRDSSARRSGTPVYWILERSSDTKTFMLFVTRN